MKFLKSINTKKKGYNYIFEDKILLRDENDFPMMIDIHENECFFKLNKKCSSKDWLKYLPSEKLISIYNSEEKSTLFYNEKGIFQSKAERKFFISRNQKGKLWLAFAEDNSLKFKYEYNSGHQFFECNNSDYFYFPKSNIIIGTSRPANRIFCMKFHNGEHLWEIETKNLLKEMPPKVENSYVNIVGKNKVLIHEQSDSLIFVTMNSHLFVVNSLDGKLKWELDNNYKPVRTEIYENRLYVFSYGLIRVFDLKGGLQLAEFDLSEKWESSNAFSLEITYPTFTKEGVFISSQKNPAYLGRLNSDSFELEEKSIIPFSKNIIPVDDSPIVLDKYIIQQDSANDLHIFEK